LSQRGKFKKIFRKFKKKYFASNLNEVINTQSFQPIKSLNQT